MLSRIIFLLFCGFSFFPPNALANDAEILTYRLVQSTTGHVVWTTPPSERVFQDQAVPEATGSGISLYAARNEFEPVQVVVRPVQDGAVTVSLGDFGAGITAELFQVESVTIDQPSDNLGREGPYPDPLWPLANGATVNLQAGVNTAFWVSVFVPKTAPAGRHATTLQIGATAVPVTLHVFNFALPDQPTVKSQMNFSHETVLRHYGVSGTGDEYWRYVLAMKQFFLDHRLTPKAPLWSGGLTSNGGAPYIDYDCAGTLSDPHGIWGFEAPARAFLDGETLRDGAGFPSFMAATFRNNDASQDQRPDRFCGQTRAASDWQGSVDTPYNQAWLGYLNAVQTYLTNLGYLDSSYYYIANEPQDQADYDAVAWYAQALKQAAPGLKLMVSEEPKPEIYAHPSHPGAKIDIWLPVLNQFDPEVSWVRERDFGEQTWVYFLHGTRPPYFNPITLDHPGIESKLTGWFLWKYRIRGLAYYSLNNWSKNPWTDPLTDGHNGDWFLLYPPSRDNQPMAYGANGHRMVPSIRLELMRDSLEDYEYLYLLNQGRPPEAFQTNPADAQADKIISGLTSYHRDSEFLYNLRRLIGLKLGGEIEEIPDLASTAGHPRAQGAPGNYYLNFQDPNDQPSADPLVVDGKTYQKIGWNAYDETLGVGWFGDLAHVKTQYLDNAPNPLQASVIYDDWGRQKTWEFDLPNGDYTVTVSAGWQGRKYARNQITVEGVPFITDEATDPYLVRTHPVTVQDHKLTLQMGIFDEYTLLNYLDIEAMSASGVPDAPQCALTTQANQVTLACQPVANADGYTLYYAPPDLSAIGQIDLDTATTLTVDLLAPLEVLLTVKARNGQGESGYSNILGLLCDRATTPSGVTCAVPTKR